MKIEPRTLKGFRDFLPDDMRKRQYVVDILRGVFESFGFEPLATPSLEYKDILTGKYGNEGDKLMYTFIDNGGREVALRYDQTVPLARVIAQYRNDITLPFKRYQIQPVWRAENTQKGRFREFLQCDIDIVGVDSSLADLEIIQVVSSSLRALGVSDFNILVNDRETFRNIPKEAVIIIDKLKKIGEEGVKSELREKGLDETILDSIRRSKPTERIEKIINDSQLSTLNSQLSFDPTLARGLDYYTGMIMEVEIRGYTGGSIGGGGRYDELIGLFSNQKIPSVGFAFGFDRLLEALEELSLFPVKFKKVDALITVFSEDYEPDSISLLYQLRKEGLNIEIYPDTNSKMEKQLKYADQKNIPNVIIIGPEEKKDSTVTIKNLSTRTQKTISIDEAIAEIKVQ